MNDPAQYQTELDKIEAALKALKAALSGEALTAAQKPLLERQTALLAGTGAIAQGANNIALSQGAVKVGGDVNGDIITGVKVVQQFGMSEIDPAGLRVAYLSHLLALAGKLSLTGIDPKAASEAQSQISLSAVYTALLTLSAEPHEALTPAPSPKGRGEEARRLSALEQLNQHPRLVILGDPGSGKSTFVNFVALCLAGEALGRMDTNLELLTAPLPIEDENRQERDQKPQPQSWKHGKLLPVRVVLRDFAARGLPSADQKATARHLWDFIVADLKDAALEAFERPLASELLKKGGLLLLDGLDEVPEAEQRRAQIKQAIEDFAAAFPKCRILVTSRTYAYQKQDWRLSGFAETVLAPFNEGQIRQFVERWYAHIAILRNWNAQDAQGRAELLKRAIFSSDRLRGLAERPLLLTLMASLHAWRGGSLPEKREELYADAVELLLDWWETQRVVRDGKGNVLMIQPSLAEWLKVDRQKVRDLLNELAYHAHAAQPDLHGTADVAETDLVSGLIRLSQNPDVKPARLVEYLRDRAGLLIPRGVGVYTFPHRTFQEYLAACYLTDHDYPDKIAELACADFNRWREATLLAGAKAARGTASAIWSLVDALCYTDVQPDCKETELWGAHLAGQALVEAVNPEAVSERNRPKLERVRDGLVQVLTTGRLPAIERARAGDTLAKLGDPRFNPDQWYLPKEDAFGFIHIPAGKFLMGSDPQVDKQAYDDEQPQHELTLPDFWIARCPVTVAQFRQFVSETDYDFDRWQWNTVENHPVVSITWYDALKYCAWLTEKLREKEKGIGERVDEELWEGLASGKLIVALPSEAEWEKAARGPLTPGPLPVGEGDRAKLDSEVRAYPWGDDFDPDKANTSETGIGEPSAVGCFPNGVSPYGALELSGNVWEWTRSLWGKDWQKPEFNYPYDPKDGRENLDAPYEIPRVLRGGSFYDFARLARCASRYSFNPVDRDWYLGFRVVVVSPYFS
jgi:formylglycine-generating enzyme required for sulfatase activity